jgi:hypothetical protein
MEGVKLASKGVLLIDRGVPQGKLVGSRLRNEAECQIVVH